MPFLTDDAIRLSEKETDSRDKLMPSINYLQRLGPEHLDLIFEHSLWVFEQDKTIALEVGSPLVSYSGHLTGMDADIRL